MMIQRVKNAKKRTTRTTTRWIKKIWNKIVSKSSLLARLMTKTRQTVKTKVMTSPETMLSPRRKSVSHSTFPNWMRSLSKSWSC